jgi:hypothetical protein
LYEHEGEGMLRLDILVKEWSYQDLSLFVPITKSLFEVYEHDHQKVQHTTVMRRKEGGEREAGVICKQYEI